MPKEFDNENRDRYYGLRKGDFVKINIGFHPNEIAKTCIVVGYGILDNNRVTLRDLVKGTRFTWVAEHCTVIMKVEDIFNLDLETIETPILHINLKQS